MTIPQYQALMLPVLRMSAERERRVKDILETIADEFKLSAEERTELLPSGRVRVLHNRIHWAKFYLTKAGLVTSSRWGQFEATPAGHALLAAKPKQINLKTLLDRPTFREFYRSGYQPKKHVKAG